ncbi:type I-E CRISPR-associated protein Cas6/Cse3/CasE [Streptomyces sp. NPDC059479]|uniref:type I-E CRISPR-associated protein Cas6/Cse3/CasE n=1 Tax=Streptomyces sp. NPDC059479 TaxID=3346848 RepID=UPI00368D8D54
MYLTRFRVNTARKEARRLLSSPHRLHGAVNMAFPEPPARDGGGPRVLWRLDHAPAGRVDLFITSPTPPDLSHLVEQVGWPSLAEQGWNTFAYDEFLDALATGDIWAFRLTANPVHHIRKDTDAPGAPTRRTAHVTPRHQIGWLLKHQERAGFAVIPRTPDPSSPVPEEKDDVLAHEVMVHDRLPIRFSKPAVDQPGATAVRSARTGHGPDVRFTRVTFDGRLRITDLPAFRKTLTQGLGKAKAYGCGLMTLAPVR